MANGVFPSLDYEQKELTDESRKEQGGKPLADGHAGALVEFRADLLEFVTACGFKRWSSNDHPCFLCHCNKENLFRFPASISASSWEDRDVASYHQHVERALMRRRIHTPEVLAELNRPLACTRLSQLLNSRALGCAIFVGVLGSCSSRPTRGEGASNNEL